MEWLVLTVLIALVVILLTLLAEKYGLDLKRFFYCQRPVGPELSDTTRCLGRSFKIGVLYTSYYDRSLPGVMLWNEDAIESATRTQTYDSSDFKVITNDSLSSKLRNLGVNPDANLAVSVASGLVEESKSAEYLRNIRKSARQARVVLQYKCVVKSDILSMERPAKLRTDELLRTQTATHVIIGVEYGSEAFLVFDKGVPEDEDYDETCMLMKSLVEKLPGFTKGKGELSEEEKLLASQLQFTFYSDFTVFESLSTFNDAIKIVLPKLTARNIMIPKKAWIYPLQFLDKNAFCAQSIEPHCATRAVELFDQLHSLELKVCNLMKHEVCRSFNGIYDQLNRLYTLISSRQKQLKEELKTLVPQIRQKECNQNQLESVLDTADSIDTFSITQIEQWLNTKEQDILYVSNYSSLLHGCPGIEFLLSQNEFDSFRGQEGTNCIVSLEFEIDQSENFDPEALSRQQFINANDITESKIMRFTQFARRSQEAKCVVTVTHNNTALQQGVIIQLYEPGSSCPSEFEFPIEIEKPTDVTTSWDSIKLKWSLTSGEANTDRPIAHTVFFRSAEEQMWQEKSFDGNATEAEVDGLDPSTEYEFKVAARYRYGLGPESLTSDSIITNKLPLAVQISNDQRLCEPLNSFSAPIPILRLKTRSVMNDAKKMIAKEEFGQPQQSTPSKVVMVMGATGAGKSTLINGMVNYILGVKYNNPFRFMLVCDGKKSQVDSVTNIITAYTFHWQEGFAIPHSLTIIDTPGFGDTRGIERDKLITAQVKDFFSIKGANGIDQIHGIGFVTQSALVRLTPTQRYVFDSILSIFGKDIQKNIFILATFADGANPPVIKAVTAANIPHADFFPFNNSALYESSRNQFAQMFWDMGYLSFTNFFQNLHKVNAISLQLTREVLREREQLESILNSIYPKLQNGFSKIDTLQKEETLLRAKDSDVLANKDFEYKVKVTKQQKKNLKTGTYVTNCLICNFTCHFPCGIPNDDDKFYCAAMDDGGPNNAKCNVCPRKCDWQHHVNNQFYFEIYEEEETRTSEDLLKRYNVAKGAKDAAEQVINGLHNELADLSKGVYADVREARHCIERLSEIALKPNPMTEVEYIDLLIESEKSEKKTGYKERIAAYMKMRKQAELMGKMTDKEIDDELNQEDNWKWWQFWKW